MLRFDLQLQPNLGLWKMILLHLIVQQQVGLLLLILWLLLDTDDLLHLLLHLDYNRRQAGF